MLNMGETKFENQHGATPMHVVTHLAITPASRGLT